MPPALSAAPLPPHDPASSLTPDLAAPERLQAHGRPPLPAHERKQLPHPPPCGGRRGGKQPAPGGQAGGKRASRPAGPPGAQRRQELATKELREATQGTDFAALDKAVEHARGYGVEQELIEAGVQRLPHLATKELQEATQGGGTGGRR